MPDNAVPIQSIALLLLAAGRAQRFGRDKLAEPVADRPLCQHAALAYAGMPFARRIAVVRADDYGLTELGFECLNVPAENAAMSASIGTGITTLTVDPKVEAVLIALGDMPLVPPDHVARLIAEFDGSAIATAIGNRSQPPALFGRGHFAALQALEGDRGARQLLGSARTIEADPALFIDTDTELDLAQVKAIMSSR